MSIRTEKEDKLYDKQLLERWLVNPPEPIKQYLKKEEEYLLQNISNYSTVLDVGCGFGRHMKILSPYVKKIIGVDYSEYMINKAERELKNYNNTELYLENAMNLHFDNNSFDYVICMLNTFGDFGELKVPILKEMKRVTKCNGKMIIDVWSEDALNYRIEAYKRAGIEMEKIEGNNINLKESHISEAFTREQLEDIFKFVNLEPNINKFKGISYLIESIKLFPTHKEMQQSKFV